MAKDITVKTWIGCNLKDPAAKKAAQANEAAETFKDFVDAARESLHIAIYDFRLDEPQAEIVLGALDEAASRGVDVRVAYFDQTPKKHKGSASFTAAGGDPFPGRDNRFLDRLRRTKARLQPVTQKGIANLESAISRRAIAGGGHLMHSKYMIRDGAQADAAVWMGSANFTTDAWSVQDNNIVMVESRALAAYYQTDFEELWTAERIVGTGKDDHGAVPVDGDEVDVVFSPGDGTTIEKDVAGLITSAGESIAIASMVISSGTIMGALIDAITRKVKVSGVYDGPEMKNVVDDWQRAIARTKSGKSAGKEEQWSHIAPLLAAKKSAPYTDKGPHNFMHNKAIVIDSKVVLTGSFNFSENAAHNAENVLTIHDPAIAAEYAAYIASLVRKFK